MKHTNGNSTTTNSSQTADRPRGAERRELVRRGLAEGKSRRQIARELRCDEGTIRRDIATLSLPADNLVAIEEGDTVEKYLDEARSAKTGRNQKALKLRRKRSRAEKVTGIHSEDLSKAVLEWLSKKGLTNWNEEILLREVKEANQDFPDRQTAPRRDVAKVIAAFDRGELPDFMPDRINFYAKVLVSALLRTTPEQGIRKSAIDKALLKIRSQERRRPMTDRQRRQHDHEHQRRQLRDPAYET